MATDERENYIPSLYDLYRILAWRAWTRGQIEEMDRLLAIADELIR